MTASPPLSLTKSNGVVEFTGLLSVLIMVWMVSVTGWRICSVVDNNSAGKERDPNGPDVGQKDRLER